MIKLTVGDDMKIVVKNALNCKTHKQENNDALSLLNQNTWYLSFIIKILGIICLIEAMVTVRGVQWAGHVKFKWAGLGRVMSNSNGLMRVKAHLKPNPL